MKIHTIEPDLLPLHANFPIGGAVCQLSTNSRALAESLSQCRGYDQSRYERSFALNVLVDASLVCREDEPPHFRGMHHLVFAILGEDELFSIDLLRHTVTGVVSEQRAQNSLFWKALLLPVTLGVLGTTIGLAPLHAACLDWEGRGLMLAGESGAGKSTLAVALAQRGFSLVSDDWTYVALESEKITAYGVSAPVKLLADASRLFPELGRLRPARSLNGELAFEVDASRIFGSRSRSSSNPKWLVFLERTEHPGCKLFPCDKDEIVDHFEASGERLPEQLSDAAVLRSQIIAELTKRDCWRLRYGGPPQIAAEALARLCGGM